MIPAHRKEHYLKQPPPIRLGSLAADLARIASFSEIGATEAIGSLIDESRAFIEWAAPELALDDAAALLDIQRGLTRWRSFYNRNSPDSDNLAALAADTGRWSDQVIGMSGLLK